MPPLRRGAHAIVTPYRRRRRRGTKDNNGDGEEGALVGTLPDDALFGILSRLRSGVAGVARCAATCRRWRRVVATRTAAIAHALPDPCAGYRPHLALGILHGADRRRGSSGRLRFVPMAASAASVRLRGLDDDGGLFDFARPVASRNGRVVLELRREARGDGLTLCVCNPVTGDVAVLPALAGGDSPGYYACAILTRDDLGADAGRWGPEGRKPGDKVSSHMLKQLGPAAVLHGVAYWPMHRAAFGVRLRLGGAAMDVRWVPYMMSHFLPDYRVLGVSPDGASLSYISAGRAGARKLGINMETLQLSVDDDDEMTMSTAADRWERQEFMRLPQLEIPGATPFRMRWFGEKSGTLVFTIGQGGTSGAFAFNLATRSVEQLADGVQWSNLCGYEMDRATHLWSLVGHGVSSR